MAKAFLCSIIQSQNLNETLCSYCQQSIISQPMKRNEFQMTLLLYNCNCIYFSFYGMHNPSMKSTRQHRTEFIALSTLLLGKQQLEPAKIRENRHDMGKFSKLGKDKLNTKMEQIVQQLNLLKIDGREINSIMSNDFKLKRNKIVPTNKYAAEEFPLYNQPPKEKRNAAYPIDHPHHTCSPYTKSHPNILVENGPTTHEGKLEVTQSGANLLPEIASNKEIYNYNYTSLKKTHMDLQKSTDKTQPTRTMQTRTRDPLDSKYSQENHTKRQIDIRKNSNFIQYKQFLLLINLTNKLLIQPQEEPIYKAFICKGNNGLLVKSIFKNRPWWSFKNATDIDNCNLVWTEWKRNKSMLLLQSKPSNGQPKELKCVPKSANQHLKQKGQKKFANFSKIVGKNSQLYPQFEQSMANQNYLAFNSKLGSKSFEQNFQKHAKDIEYETIGKNSQRKMVNHIPGCLFLHSKKLLFLSMCKYYQKLEKDVFEVIPLTFLITKGVNDPQFQRFSQYFQDLAATNQNQKPNNNVWICKPGENSNRGNGIQVISSLSEIRALLTHKSANGRTLIIQKYMQNPFLYNKRKFDIRCYILITCVNGFIKGYWYEQGYVRTASKQYTLKNLDNKLIHLTNDAIQKKGEEYGKFQNFNKVSFAELQRYIEANTEVKFKSVYQNIRKIATDLIISVASKINPTHKEFTFEIFGLDFMLDERLNPYLIEANSNPCLQVDGNVLGRVIPAMIQNAIKVAIDPIFPPPNAQLRNKFTPGSTFQTNKMMLVYDSQFDFPKQVLSDELVEAAQKECEQFEGQIDEQ